MAQAANEKKYRLDGLCQAQNLSSMEEEQITEWEKVIAADGVNMQNVKNFYKSKTVETFLQRREEQAVRRHMKDAQCHSPLEKCQSKPRLNDRYLQHPSGCFRNSTENTKWYKTTKHQKS